MSSLRFVTSNILRETNNGGSTFAHARVSKNLALAKQLIQQEREKKKHGNNEKDGEAAAAAAAAAHQLALDLLTARLLHHVLQLAGPEFASEQLAAQSLEASRCALVNLTSMMTTTMKAQSNNNHDDESSRHTEFASLRAGLNYAIRDAIAILHRHVRISAVRSCSPSFSPLSSATRIMVASQDIGPYETICGEKPFSAWKGHGFDIGLKAFRTIINNNINNININTAAAAVPSIADAEKPDVIWTPDVVLSDAVTLFLSNSAAGSSTRRQDYRDLAAIRANCHHYVSAPMKEEAQSSDGGGAVAKHNNSNSTAAFKSNNNTDAAVVKEEDGVALFDVLSKMQHSCAPNCHYDGKGRLLSGGGAAVTSRKEINKNSSSNNNNGDDAANGQVVIKQGEALAFSYMHRAMLLRGTEERRASLHRSHSFVCGCSRCADLAPLRHGRSFLCRSSSCTNTAASAAGAGTVAKVVRLVGGGRRRNTMNRTCSTSRGVMATSLDDELVSSSGNDAEEQDSWICIECGDVPSAAEVARFLLVEERIKAAVCSDLLPALLVTSENKGTSPPKDIFDKIQSNLLECLSVLGKNHWLYLECIRCAINFHLRVAAMSTAIRITVSMCLESALRWAMKFLAAAERQHVVASSPTAVASYIFDPAMTLLTRLGNSTWRIHAALLIQTAVDADASFDLKRRLPDHILALAGKAMKIYRESPDVLLGGGAASSSTSMGLHTTLAAGGGGGGGGGGPGGSGSLARNPLDAVCRAAEIDSDDATLLASWGNFLADRVSRALQQKDGGLTEQLRAKLQLPPA